MTAALMYLKDVRLTFGGDAIFDNASLTVEPRARIALVGRNGSGKSTLLKVAAGWIEPDAGERYVDPKATIVYLPQEPDLSAHATITDVVRDGLSPTSNPHDADRLIEEFELSPEATPATLSGGEARRAALARALVGDPDVILLDEPTNHLDLAFIEKLENRLAQSDAALVLISHDRRFLETLTNRTVWIDRGVTRSLDRGFSSFEAWRDKVLEEEETEAHKLDRKIAREEDWVRYGVTARRKRNVRRMAELAALREKQRTARKAQGGVSFSANQADASGKKVIEAQGVSKSFGDHVVVDTFSITINRGDRIGFVGPNGAGKTTLLKLLMGELPPDAGEVKTGARLEAVTLDQRRASLLPTARVADAITDGRGDWVTIGGEKRHAATYLKDFLFGPEQWRAPVSSLSGGERGRLALAAALAKPSNLLVLDEPTNDLDLETLDLLEELLADYPGTLLLVSHDRSFLDRVVTSVVAPDTSNTPGRWTENVGGYSDLLARRKTEAAASSDAVSKGASSKAAPTTGKAPSSKPSAGATKLSYKEKYALEQLPGKMEALGQEIETLKNALEDPTLFDKNPDAFAKKADALAKAENDLSQYEEEWLALEMKRESLEG